MSVAMVEITSLEFPEDVVDCLTEDAFESDQSIEDRISAIVTYYYRGKDLWLIVYIELLIFFRTLLYF